METRILPLVAAALMAGCGSYHEYMYPVIDERIEAHLRRTEEVVAEGDAGRLSATQSREYLKYACDSARVFHEIAVKGEGATLRAATLEQLAKQYEVLLASGKPLHSSTAIPLQATFRELRRLERSKHYLVASREPEAIRSTSLFEDTPWNDHDSSKCRKHDDHHDRCPKDRHH